MSNKKRSHHRKSTPLAPNSTPGISDYLRWSPNVESATLAVVVFEEDFSDLCNEHDTWLWEPDDFWDYLDSCEAAFDELRAHGVSVRLTTLDINELEEFAEEHGIAPDSPDTRARYATAAAKTDTPAWTRSFFDWVVCEVDMSCLEVWATLGADAALGIDDDASDIELSESDTLAWEAAFSADLAKFEKSLSGLLDAVTDLLCSPVFGNGIRTITCVRGDTEDPTLTSMTAHLTEDALHMPETDIQMLTAGAVAALATGGALLVTIARETSDGVVRDQYGWACGDGHYEQLPPGSFDGSPTVDDLVDKCPTKSAHHHHLTVVTPNEDTIALSWSGDVGWDDPHAAEQVNGMLAIGAQFSMVLRSIVPDGQDVLRGWVVDSFGAHPLPAKEVADAYSTDHETGRRLKRDPHTVFANAYPVGR